MIAENYFKHKYHVCVYNMIGCFNACIDQKVILWDVIFGRSPEWAALQINAEDFTEKFIAKIILETGGSELHTMDKFFKSGREYMTLWDKCIDNDAYVTVDLRELHEQSIYVDVERGKLLLIKDYYTELKSPLADEIGEWLSIEPLATGRDY